MVITILSAALGIPEGAPLLLESPSTHQLSSLEITQAKEQEVGQHCEYKPETPLKVRVQVCYYLI